MIDATMGAYITLLRRRAATNNQKAYLFQTYFANNLQTCTATDYSNVERYTRRVSENTESNNLKLKKPHLIPTQLPLMPQINVFEQQMLLIPVNVNNMNYHWYLVVVNIKDHTIMVLDPLGGNGRAFVALVSCWLCCEATRKRVQEHTWTHINAPNNTPHQENG